MLCNRHARWSLQIMYNCRSVVVSCCDVIIVELLDVILLHLIMRISVRIAIVVLVLVCAVAFWIWPQTRYLESSDQADTWEEFEPPSSKSKTKKHSRSLSSNIVTDKDVEEYINSSDYSRLILDHEFPDCRNRTIYNGKSSYSLAGVLKKVREFVPPPEKFVPNLKNPCWYANYDSAKKEIDWKAKYPPKVPMLGSVSLHFKNQNGIKSLYCLPYMHLLGYPKCGTSSLYNYFRKHSEFASTRSSGWIGLYSGGIVKDRLSTVKSMLFLVENFHQASGRVQSSSADYNKNNMIIADFSPANSWRQRGFEQSKGGSMCDPPLLLREMQPDAKFVVLLREPISRLYSAFWFYAKPGLKKQLMQNNGPQLFTNDVHTFFDRLKHCSKDASMLTCIRAAKEFNHHFQWDEQFLTGFYYLYLLPWLQVFPRKNFLFIRNEDMREDTGKVLKEIFEFLDMSPMPDDELKQTVKKVAHNQKIIHGNNSNLLLSPSTKKQLRAYFRPFNEKLAELLEDDKFLWEDVE